jgi:hypothetical protein
VCPLNDKEFGVVFKGREGLVLSVTVDGAESPFVPVVGGHQVLLKNWAAGGLSKMMGNVMCYDLSRDLDRYLLISWMVPSSCWDSQWHMRRHDSSSVLAWVDL